MVPLRRDPSVTSSRSLMECNWLVSMVTVSFSDRDSSHVLRCVAMHLALV